MQTVIITDEPAPLMGSRASIVSTVYDWWVRYIDGWRLVEQHGPHQHDPERAMSELVYTVVGVKSGSWKWGRRVEVRVHAPDVNPKGRGYLERCAEVHVDLNAASSGPRSRYGMLIRELEAEGIEASK